MPYFNASEFMATGGYIGEVIDDPTKPIAKFGQVRSVELVELDLPFLMVTFTQIDVARAVGITRQSWEIRCRHLMPLPPMFKAEGKIRKGDGWANSNMQVYLYPEAVAMHHATTQGIKANDVRFAKLRRTMLKQMTAAREIATEMMI